MNEEYGSLEAESRLKTQAYNEQMEGAKCGNVKPSKIDVMITRINDAIGRVSDMRVRLAQRNDRLFGTVPCTVAEDRESDKTAGAVNELHGLIEILHQNMALVDEELNRQDGLV